MKTTDKIHLIEEETVARYHSTTDIDAICADLVQSGEVQIGSGKDKLSFSEIRPLVKFIGEQHGFIVPLAKRKEKLETMLKSVVLTYETFEALEEDAKAHSKAHNIPKKWVFNKICGIITDQGGIVPKKSNVLPWQKAMVDCFLNNPECTKEELMECISQHKKETKVPAAMLPMLQYMFKEMNK